MAKFIEFDLTQAKTNTKIMVAIDHIIYIRNSSVTSSIVAITHFTPATNIIEVNGTLNTIMKRIEEARE